MLLTFDFSSETPLYIQLRNQIVVGIANGELTDGEKLPTIRALSDEAGINMMTVSKAYQLLKQEGYIITDRRNGAIVKSDNHFDSRECERQLKLTLSELKLGGFSKDKIIKIINTIYGD